MKVRVLLADDYSVVRQGMRMFLALDDDIEVVGEARNGAEAVRLAAELQPDVVLMDILMPVMDGLQATTAIRREMPDVEVVALATVLEDARVLSALQAGAIGYLVKDFEADELRRAIKAAAGGQVQLSPAAAARLVQDTRPQVVADPDALTAREREVLRHVARGLANKEIARALGIGEKTVKTHVSNILSKLRVLSRTQAALHALRMGLVTQDEL